MKINKSYFKVCPYFGISIGTAPSSGRMVLLSTCFYLQGEQPAGGGDEHPGEEEQGPEQGHQGARGKDAEPTAEDRKRQGNKPQYTYV